MGIIISISIIILWIANLIYSLTFVEFSFTSFRFYFHFIIQIFLFTGLFITGHDAMHNSISKNRNINKLIGYLSTFLFAGLSFKKLVDNHKKHHAYAGTVNDPDYSSKYQNPLLWFIIFFSRYISIQQILIMAILFNILKYFYNESSVFMFWVIPALLSTFQLFYFGTYIPHRLPHTENMNPYNSRTLKKNHFIAFITCYFFGYHYEHHYNQNVPWWKLYKIKEQLISEKIIQ